MNTKNKNQKDALVIAANAVRGTHEGHITCTLDMSIDPHLLVTMGSEDGRVKNCGPVDRPIGVAMDHGASGDVVDVALLGLTRETVLIRTEDNVKMGDWVYTAGRGRVFSNVPSKTEVHFLVGMAVAAAPAGGLVEVNTCLPRETHVFCREDMMDYKADA